MDPDTLETIDPSNVCPICGGSGLVELEHDFVGNDNCANCDTKPWRSKSRCRRIRCPACQGEGGV